MNPRFDVYRKQSEHFIKWVGSATSLEEAEKLLRIDSRSANNAEHRYVIVHSAYGLSETVVKPLSDSELEPDTPATIDTKRVSNCDGECEELANGGKIRCKVNRGRL